MMPKTFSAFNGKACGVIALLPCIAQRVVAWRGNA